MLTRRRLLLLGGAAGGAAAAGQSVSAAGYGVAEGLRGEPRDPVDVRRYGAAGDGRRDDARTINRAVQAALADARASGTETAIRLPRGRYRLAREMFIDPLVTVVFDPGAVIAPDPGIGAITIYGPIHAGPQRLFADGGTVRIGHPGPVNVLWFGARDGRESTAAFRRAIDAIMWGKTATWRQGRGTIEVPPTRAGFRVKGLRVPAGVRLRGAGANGSRLVNDGADGQPTLVVAGLKGQVVRDVRIEGLYLEGNPRSGDGIRFEDHAFNEISDCIVRGHGGDGIVARKRESTMSDSLSLTDVSVFENRGAGLRIGRNSHGCAAHNCEFLNNAGGNAVISGTYFNMWGGQVNAIGGADGLRLDGVNSGGLWGVGFEATPGAKTASVLLRLAAARAVVIAGCDFTPSGNDGACTCLQADRALDCTLIGPMFDANSKGDVVALAVGAASENLQVISPRFGKNHGSGKFTALDNRSPTTALTSGHGRPLLPAFVAVLRRDTGLSVAGGRGSAVRFDSLAAGPATAGFDSAAGRFVAPVDGLYHFDAQLGLAGGPADGYPPQIRLHAGSESVPGVCVAVAAAGERGGMQATVSATVRLARGQAAAVELASPDRGRVTVRAGARFSGYLVA
jgi:hypothetical protein